MQQIFMDFLIITIRLVMLLARTLHMFLDQNASYVFLPARHAQQSQLALAVYLTIFYSLQTQHA